MFTEEIGKAINQAFWICASITFVLGFALGILATYIFFKVY